MDERCDPLSGAISRRDFLKLSGAALVTLSLPAFLQNGRVPTTLVAQRAEYEPQPIGRLSELKSGQPLSFFYPWEHPGASNFLIRLNERAAGGVGPQQNVVAFNSFCSHQGGALSEQFHDDIGVAGPCPLHWTTFDLTRHGMVISGHATQGLPQIILETRGDDIFALGILGLLYGYSDNRLNPST